MVIARHRLWRNIRLTIQIFSDPTELPLIAANRCIPAVCAVSELTSEALTWCTRVRNDATVSSVCVVLRSGWKPSALLIANRQIHGTQN